MGTTKFTVSSEIGSGFAEPNCTHTPTKHFEEYLTPPGGGNPHSIAPLSLSSPYVVDTYSMQYVPTVCGSYRISVLKVCAANFAAKITPEFT